MPCCNDAVLIESCPPFANAADVQREFQARTACCKGSIGSEPIDPVTDPADAMAEAFAEGIGGGSCACDVIWITSDSGTVWGSWDRGLSFIFIGSLTGGDGDCCNGLALPFANFADPIEDAATVVAAAFPQGVPPICECPMISVPITDGPTYVSYDSGANFFIHADQPYCKFAGSGFTPGAGVNNYTIPLDTVEDDLYGNMAGVLPGQPNDVAIPVKGKYLITARLRFNNAGSTAAGEMHMTVERYGLGGTPGLRETTYSNMYTTTTNTMAMNYVASTIMDCEGPSVDQQYLRMRFYKAVAQTVPAINLARIEVYRLP